MSSSLPRSSRSVAVVLVALMVLALFPVADGAPVTAETTCPEGTVLDSATGKCVEPTKEPELPTPEPTKEPEPTQPPLPTKEPTTEPEPATFPPEPTEPTPPTGPTPTMPPVPV
jgi:outer membrane biosynthesis protein TonB